MRDTNNKRIKDLLEKYGIITVAAVPVIVVLGIMIVTLAKPPESANVLLPTVQESTSAPEPATKAAKPEPETSATSLRRNAYPDIQALMERYFEAKLSCDVEALRQIVNPMSGYTQEGLEFDLGLPASEEFRRVENYQNIMCYTKPGLLQDTYVVWVYYETKYLNAGTAAPSMFKAYVCTDDMGVYIYNGAIEGEISNYLDEVSQDEDVVALVNSVNQQLDEACGSDEGLQGIFDILWGVAEPAAE